MEDYFALAAYAAYLLNGLQHAGFIIGRHHRKQDGLVRKRFPRPVKIDQAVSPQRQPGHTVTRFLQTLAAIEHRFVLAQSSNDVVAPLAPGLGHALDSEVVTLRGARGKDNLPRRS